MSAENVLASLIEELEQDRSLDEPRHLRQRTEAVDALMPIYRMSKPSEQHFITGCGPFTLGWSPLISNSTSPSVEKFNAARVEAACLSGYPIRRMGMVQLIS